ncbi:isomerase [Streptomyces sp. V2]|uniref:5-carboxymethyl-2-hydroxymuconate Delta-isomerase n=1 Tax=Streptomyces niveiscabiei TaxID=164115 RepID=A0ABW9HYZ5_9ACTN|nr:MULTISPECIES: 5-carboxymethyl-2-hydroxymuconate Delta-isomerase [Streptomyces]PWG11894.1 isomerase [Streptomyces sp. V2]QZZ27436.1 5-carboxymethyl-2-hydroxymuconate Delta-isomerase [Streptomyces sp. ST1015]
MPQITVDHSAELTQAFDHAAFARALHTAVVEIAAAKPEACKTQFRAAGHTAFGYEEEGHAVVHVTLGLLAGRTTEVKAELTAAVLELLKEHLPAEGWHTVHASAEVRELDPSYTKAQW